MSFTEVNLLSVSIRQYFYKLKAYSSLFHSLIIVQLIALLFSSGGVASMAGGNGGLSVSLKGYSSDIVIIFSLLWIMFIAIQLSTKTFKNMEIPLVTNRLSGNLSNIGFLTTACIYGGITSSLLGVLLRLIAYWAFDRSQIVLSRFSPTELILSIFAAIFYMCLISALGYFIGVLIQVHGAFAIILPALLLGVLKVNHDFVFSVFAFFVYETSLAVFVLKVIFISTILFGVSILTSNRMEVSK